MTHKNIPVVGVVVVMNMFILSCSSLLVMFIPVIITNEKTFIPLAVIKIKTFLLTIVSPPPHPLLVPPVPAHNSNSPRCTNKTYIDLQDRQLIKQHIAMIIISVQYMLIALIFINILWPRFLLLQTYSDPIQSTLR